MDEGDNSSLLTRLRLDLRGRRFTIEREVLMNLPESVLLCLFPNGLVLSRQPALVGGGGGGAKRGLGAEGEEDEDEEEEEEEEEVYMVDFDPSCLSYVLDFFKGAQDDFYGIPGHPSRRALAAASPINQQLVGNEYNDGGGGFGGGPSGPSLLLSKQAIIVLREELEYFSIPPKKTAAQGLTHETTDEKGAATPSLLKLKQECGNALLDRKQIFTALQRNVNKENNMAEQHLIDMLCMSGFDRDDTWGFRAVEPSRCCITSIALVLLKTGISLSPHDEAIVAAAAASSGADEHDPELQVDQQQLNTAQKLLLFWRKPARKCWWDGVDVVLPFSPEDDKKNSGAEQAKEKGAVKPASAAAEAEAEAVAATTGGGMTQAEVDLLKSGKGRRVRVWARRVWTLELSLI